MHKLIRKGVLGVIAVFATLALTATPGAAATVVLYDAEVQGGTILMFHPFGLAGNVDMAPLLTSGLCPDGDLSIHVDTLTQEYSVLLQSLSVFSPSFTSDEFVALLFILSLEWGAYDLDGLGTWELGPTGVLFLVLIFEHTEDCEKGDHVCAWNGHFELSGEVDGDPANLGSGDTATLSSNRFALNRHGPSCPSPWSFLTQAEIQDLAVSNFQVI